jgi:hypothetical protein
MHVASMQVRTLAASDPLMLVAINPWRMGVAATWAESIIVILQQDVWFVVMAFTRLVIVPHMP